MILKAQENHPDTFARPLLAVAATHLGFKRVGKKVDETFRSAINGAIRRDILN